MKKYKVVDAKTAKYNLETEPDLINACTKNQKPIYQILDGDAAAGMTILKVEMRGGQAKDAFDIVGKTEITLVQGVEFWVNRHLMDFNQYKIRSRKL